MQCHAASSFHAGQLLEALNDEKKPALQTFGKRSHQHGSMCPSSPGQALSSSSLPNLRKGHHHPPSCSAQSWELSDLLCLTHSTAIQLLRKSHLLHLCLKQILSVAPSFHHFPGTSLAHGTVISSLFSQFCSPGCLYPP